jgi:hypothetical protein
LFIKKALENLSQGTHLSLPHWTTDFICILTKQEELKASEHTQLKGSRGPMLQNQEKFNESVSLNGAGSTIYAMLLRTCAHNSYFNYKLKNTCIL